MLISTILLIANLAALIINEAVIVSWSTVIICYVVEIGVYVILSIVWFMFIKWIVSRWIKKNNKIKKTQRRKIKW